MRRPVLLALLALLVLSVPASASAAQAPVKHVFVLVLENKSYDETFQLPSQAPYLTQNLAGRGALVPNFYGVTHFSLGNYIAMLSGQGSNPQTQTDCQFYTPFTPGTIGAEGQALGLGCVLPAQVKTLADQLQGRGLSWKGYMQDMKTSCRHPAIGARDTTQSAKVGDQYAARHNPFVYFHSIIDSPACAQRDVDLSALPQDLKSESTTPNFTFITPNLCEDGHDGPCVDKRPGGLVSSDAFLRTWVPRVLSSPAYKKDGLLMITFDEAETGGSFADATACCGETKFPNTTTNSFSPVGDGGGRIGAVLLSPFIDGGTISHIPYNHFSLLRTVEDLFGLSHLGYAARSNLNTFSSDVYTCFDPRTLSRPRGGRYSRGALIRITRLARGVRHRGTLEVRLNAGRAHLEVKRGKRMVRLGRSQGGTRCRKLYFRLPTGHGHVTVVAANKFGTERRTTTF